jgi:hypothetical protein
MLSRDCRRSGSVVQLSPGATNSYVWDSNEAAEGFFSEELRERVTGFYGVAPSIAFVEIAQIVDNSVS